MGFNLLWVKLDMHGEGKWRSNFHFWFWWREREREREILVYDGIGDQVTKVCNLSCGRLAYIYWSSSCHGKSIQYFFKGKIKGYSKVIC